MSLQKLLLQPGVNTLATQTLAEGTWVETNCVRFREGYLEKNLGWQRMSDQQVAKPANGVARSLHGLTDTDGISYLAIGSNTNLEVLSLGQIYDITPLRATENVTVSLDTTDTSTTVTIHDTAHGAVVGSEVIVVVPISVGGVIVHGVYVVTAVPSADEFEIEVSFPATATVSAGGAVPEFVTANADATVTVNFDDHGYQVGDIFDIEVSTSVGGLDLVGSVIVDTVPDADTFTFEWTSTAGSADSAFENGGNARYQYLLEPGPSSTYTTQGYGSGGYGLGTYGIGDPGATFLVPLRYWFLENIGETLMAAVSQGTLYEWTSPVTNRAVEVTEAPDIMTAMFVTMPATCVVALGAEVLGVQDPLLVRWSDSGDYYDWIAAVGNQAGSYRLSHGQRIVGGLQGPMSALIWTDSALWQMQYVQPPFVFTFKMISEGCGLIAPLAMGTLNSNVYWMGLRGFYRYGSGAPETIPCPIWDNIFLDLDTANMDKCICGIDSADDEVYWFYPSLSGGTGEIDSYVRMNTDGQWDFGPAGTLLSRTAWGSTEGALAPSVDLNSYVQQQEIGFDADQVAMTGVVALSAYLDIEDGKQMYKVDQCIPDFKWRGTDPEVQLTFYAVDHPSEVETPRVFGPYTVTPQTKYFTILPAIRARQVAVKITSDKLGTWWRLGAIRLRTAPSGVRPQSGG